MHPFIEIQHVIWIPCHYHCLTFSNTSTSVNKMSYDWLTQVLRKLIHMRKISMVLQNWRKCFGISTKFWCYVGDIFRGNNDEKQLQKTLKWPPRMPRHWGAFDVVYLFSHTINHFSTSQGALDSQSFDTQHLFG